MQTTIDRAGRVVIPKSLRDAMRWGEGATVDLRLEDGRLIVEAAPVRKEVVEGPHGPILRATQDVPRLTADEVRAMLEDLRR